MVFPPNVETDLDNYFFNYLDGLGMLLTVVHCYRIVVIEFLVANMTLVAIHSLEVRSDIAFPLGFVLADVADEEVWQLDGFLHIPIQPIGVLAKNPSWCRFWDSQAKTDLENRVNKDKMKCGI